jgi:hypothetical protein
MVIPPFILNRSSAVSRFIYESENNLQAVSFVELSPGLIFSRKELPNTLLQHQLIDDLHHRILSSFLEL